MNEPEYRTHPIVIIMILALMIMVILATAYPDRWTKARIERLEQQCGLSPK